MDERAPGIVPYPSGVVTKMIVFVIGGVVALNVALLVGAMLVAALDRRRRKRDIRELETIWDLTPRRPAVGALRTATELLPPRSSRSMGARKLVGVTLVAALAFVGTASASPGARTAVSSVFTTVTRGLGLHETQGAQASGVGTFVSAAPATDVVRGAGSVTGGSRGGSGAGSSPSSGDSPADAGGSTIADPGAAPLAATTVSASGFSSSAVSVQWDDIRGESSYELQRSPDGMSGWDHVVTLSADTTSYLDTGLASNTLYWYHVIATSKGSVTSESAPTSATTLIGVADPTVLTATVVSPTEVDLSWTDVGTETGYRIERSLDGVTWSGVDTVAQDVTTYSDTTVAAGTSYSYRVIATNAAGDSAPSNVEPANTPADATTPSDPPAGSPAG